MSGDKRLTKKLRKDTGKEDDETDKNLKKLQDHGGRGGSTSEEPDVPLQLPKFVGSIESKGEVLKPIARYRRD
jgi:hypothetical protein